MEECNQQGCHRESDAENRITVGNHRLFYCGLHWHKIRKEARPLYAAITLNKASGAKK